MNESTKSVYEFIKTFIHLNHFSPTYREIADGCYISRGSVVHHLDRLEIQRKITRTPGKSRSIGLIDQSE